MQPEPRYYRWDVYCNRRTPTLWRNATPGKIKRACRALRMPHERLRIIFSNGQQVVYKIRRYT